MAVSVEQSQWDSIFRTESMPKCRHCGEYFNPDDRYQTDCPGRFSHQTWEEHPGVIVINDGWGPKSMERHRGKERLSYPPDSHGAEDGK